MTDAERIDRLEARDQRRESEHTRLLEKVERLDAKLRHETQEDYECAMRAVDARLGEFAAREPDARPALAAATARAVARRVDELLACSSFDALDGETIHVLVSLMRLVERMAAALAEPPAPAVPAA